MGRMDHSLGYAFLLEREINGQMCDDTDLRGLAGWV